MIEINSFYKTALYGYVKVLKYIGNGKYELQFADSGSIVINDTEAIKSGHIRDPLYGLNLNRIYYSNNYGAYKIINIFRDNTKYAKATIQFLATGNIYHYNIDKVKYGTVNDRNATCKIPLDTTLLSESDRDIRIRYILRNMWREMKKKVL